MYNTQITIENTTICFSFSLTELDLYWSKVFVEGTWKCTEIQTIIACNYLNLISFQLTFQHFHIFSPSRVFFILLTSTLFYPAPAPQFQSIFVNFYPNHPPRQSVDINSKRSNTCNCKPTISYQLKGINFLVYKVDSRCSILYSILYLLHAIL